MLALVGGTIYVSPTEEPIRNGVVLIDGEKIAEVGPTLSRPAERIDCSGLTITAGFCNSHVHFFERKWADAGNIPAPELTRQLQETFTRFGFTSVFDLSSMWQNTRRIRDRIESGEVDGPRIRSTGEGLVPPGALPPDPIINFMGLMKAPLPEINDAAQATAVAKKLLDQGVDGIKLFLSSPSGTALAEDVIESVVSEAHARGKPVFAHPNTTDDVLRALRCGVDVIAHTTPRSSPWDNIDSLRATLTPTLSLWKYFTRHDRASAQDSIVSNAIAQLRAWRGKVLFGTDLGAVDPDPAEEFALMAEAGMSVSEILASLTTGRVAAGQPADLAVWKETPSAVQYTLRGGKIIYRAGSGGPRSHDQQP